MDEQEQPKLIPRRSSRGVRPPPSEQQKKKDDQIYGQMFGSLQSQDSQSDQSFSEQTGLKPLEYLFRQNFSNYSYGRGYHYFFDLNEFKRVDQNPSYAYDDQNKFKYTYSKEQVKIGNTTVGQLINRKLIGLPITNSEDKKRPSKDKNICHGELFSIEDKKYYNSRLLVKYKIILKYLQKLTISKKIQQFTQLKKDHLIPQIVDLNVSIQKKKELLQAKIKVIQERMHNMSPFWQAQDNMYYHFSQNQRFHNKTEQFNSTINQMLIVCKLVQKVDSIHKMKNKEQLKSWSINKIIQQAFMYEGQKQSSISQLVQNRLIQIGNQHFKNNLNKNNEQSQFSINPPLFVFYFGQSKFLKLIDHFVASKVYTQDQGIFYALKNTLRRVFSQELPQKMLQNNSLMEDYTPQIYQVISDIQSFYKKQQTKTNEFPSLDDFVALDEFKYSHQINLLNAKTKTSINAKDFIIIYIYSKICKALNSLKDYIYQNQRLLELMVNKNYQKYHHGISQILLSQEFSSLTRLIVKLSYIITNPNPFPQINLQLYFWMNPQNGVGVVWKQQESNDWQTQKEESEQPQSEESKPSKKIKLNE